MAEGKSVPDWIWNPRNRVLGIVTGWLVAGLLTFNQKVVGGILGVGNAYLEAFDVAGSSALLAFGDAGRSFLDALGVVNTALANAAYSAGPAGPLVAAGLFVVLAVASAVALRGLLNALKWIT